MLKEIFEQTRALENAIRGRLDLEEATAKFGGLNLSNAELRAVERIVHGPIAMIDDQTPTVFVIPTGAMFDKTLANLEEIKARKGPIIALTTEDKAADLARKAEEVIPLPETLESLVPLLAVVPLQLLAYPIAVARGCDVDKPRNLAKSVTVE